MVGKHFSRLPSRNAARIVATTVDVLWSPLRMVAAGSGAVKRRAAVLLRGDAGMSTAEYAMGTIAAAAFASVLYAVVTSDSVRDAVTSLIERSLQDMPI